MRGRCLAPTTDRGQYLPLSSPSVLTLCINFSNTWPCAWYTSSIYMTATKNQNRTTLFSSRPKDKATRSGVDGEFAKTLFRQKSSWAFSSLALSHTFPSISYRLPCSSAFPPTGEKFENHQTAKWSKWPTICPAKLIWVVYLSRNV